MRHHRLAAPLLLPLLALACAPQGPAAGLATTAPVSPTAQQATPPSAPVASADGPACLSSPDFSRKPAASNGRRAEWVARPNGNGCYWINRRA